MLDLLTPLNTNLQYLCPWLEDFESDMVGFSDETLSTFVKSRMHPVIKIFEKCVRALFLRSSQLDIYEK